MLTGFVERPFDIFELKIDVGTPSAVMVVRQADRGMATRVFASPESRSRVERTATLAGGTLTTVSAAPEVRTRQMQAGCA